MSSAEVQGEGVFDVEEDIYQQQSQTQPQLQADYSYNISEEVKTESPSKFLNNLTQEPEIPAASSFSTSSKPTTEFMPAISPSLMLSSMANSSPAAENILSAAKERMNQIRPWKDFFALDQFRIPESSTAAQSRASHNFGHFQNNYLIILLLFTGFSLLSDLSLLMVAAVILGGFYFISTLKHDFTVKLGGQDISVKQINYGWIAMSVILLYMSSALSAVFWIFSFTAIITIAHAAFHDIAIENEFNSV